MEILILVRITFGSRGGKRSTVKRNDRSETAKTAEDGARHIKAGMEKPAGEDCRERSLAIHGLLCGRCSREFNHANRHLLAVHHKDGNHHSNRPMAVIEKISTPIATRMFIAASSWKIISRVPDRIRNALLSMKRPVLLQV